MGNYRLSGLNRYHYNSLEEILAAADAVPLFQNLARSAVSSFFGGSYKDAVEQAREGVNVETIALGLEEMRHEVQMPETVYDVCGAVVDMGAFMSGVPECMMDFQQTDDNKFVEINYDVTEAGGTDPMIFAKKAIAIASLVDELEAKRYRVKLNVHEIGVYNYKSTVHISVCVKDYQNKMTVSQIAGVTRQLFFRRIMWSIYCMIGRGGNYGAVPNSDDFETMKLPGIVIRGQHGGGVSANNVKEFVEHYTKGYL